MFLVVVGGIVAMTFGKRDSNTPAGKDKPAKAQPAHAAPPERQEPRVVYVEPEPTDICSEVIRRCQEATAAGQDTKNLCGESMLSTIRVMRASGSYKRCWGINGTMEMLGVGRNR